MAKVADKALGEDDLDDIPGPDVLLELSTIFSKASRVKFEGGTSIRAGSVRGAGASFPGSLQHVEEAVQRHDRGVVGGVRLRAEPVEGGTWALTHRRSVCFARSNISSVSDSMK